MPSRSRRPSRRRAATTGASSAATAIVPPLPRILITRIGVKLEDHPLVGEAKQARFLRRLLQSCYWLGAPVVAYPDVVVEGKDAGGAGLALRVGQEARAGLAVWREVLQWRRVARLSLGSLSGAILPEPGAAGPEQ